MICLKKGHSFTVWSRATSACCSQTREKCS